MNFGEKKVNAGLLDLTRTLDVNALINSGNGNGGNGVEENQVDKDQNYNQRIYRKQRDDDD